MSLTPSFLIAHLLLALTGTAPSSTLFALAGPFCVHSTPTPFARLKTQLKERQKEDHLYQKEERFVTSAYRKKLEEDKKWQEEQRRRCACTENAKPFGLYAVIYCPVV